MKKAYVKIFVTALLALMAALSVFAGCGTESAAVIASVPENATVEVGDDFDFSTAAILCGKTVYRPSQVKITFGDDAENVEFTGDKFTVQKAGKYSIEFNFDVEKKTHTYSTVVTGVDTTAPSIAGGDKLPVRIEKGVATELPEFTAFDLCDGAVATTVKVFELDGSGKKTENEITPQEGKITVNTYNGAVIEVSAKDAAGNPTAEEYKISVRGEREVNYFENTAYALGDMLILGYDLNAELNEDPAYAIEGNNSIKMTVKGWNPRIRLSSVSEVIGTVGKENIKELTFWDAADCP